jgi:hypothetical protein
MLKVHTLTTCSVYGCKAYLPFGESDYIQDSKVPAITLIQRRKIVTM